MWSLGQSRWVCFLKMFSLRLSTSVLTSNRRFLSFFFKIFYSPAKWVSYISSTTDSLFFSCSTLQLLCHPWVLCRSLSCIVVQRICTHSNPPPYRLNFEKKKNPPGSWCSELDSRKKSFNSPIYFHDTIVETMWLIWAFILYILVW